MSFSPDNLKRLWQNIKEYVQNNAGSTQDIDYATSNTAGIIKVGEGLTIDENGVLSVDMSMFTPTSSATTSFYSIYDTTTYSVASSAYSGDEYLTAATFTAARTIGSGAFYGCAQLSSVSLPACTTIGADAFGECGLRSIALPSCTYIGDYAFDNATALRTVDLTQVSSVPTLGSRAFFRTPIELSMVFDYSVSTTPEYGSIYVPASLYGAFVTAPNWSSASSQAIISRTRTRTR